MFSPFSSLLTKAGVLESWGWVGVGPVNNFIFSMEFQERDDQIQECITEHDFVPFGNEEEIDLKIDISRKIHQQLPANELRHFERPSLILPRTFFLQKPLYLLPEPLNAPCLETVAKVKQGRLVQNLNNPCNLSLSKYFGGQQWRCVYNKLSAYRQDSQQFSGRFKSLDLLLDYNWKSFKPLELQVRIPGDFKEEDSIDSDFESGNLCRAYTSTVSNEVKEYHLVIQNDLNTYGYNNWFFFRVRNSHKGLRRFNLLNIIKKSPFYHQGMLVSIFSLKKWHEGGLSWHKAADNLTFASSPFHRDHHQDPSNYYALTFEYNFQYQFDEVYFATNQPYTYTRLANLIQECKHTVRHIELEVKTIGYSISNNILPLIRLSKSNSKAEEVIVMIGRQHPCETVGSFIIEGIMRQFSQPSELTNLLLDHFQIHILPMVNPDGVIHGYSRTNMAGLDLNRQWCQSILKELTPQSMKFKQYLMNLSRSKKIKYVIDFHGHGKKLNSFLFCCKPQNMRENCRLLPFVLKKREKRFNLSNCTYGISKDKETTLRALTNSLGISQSYTLQTSLFGWKNDENEILHFNEHDYFQIAASVLQSISILQIQSESTEKMFGTTKAKLLAELSCIIDALEREQRLNDSKDNLSDSDPEGDRLDVKDLLTKCENKLIKKKIQQSLNLHQKVRFKINSKSNPTANRQTIRILSFKNTEASAPRKQIIKKTEFKKVLPESKEAHCLESSEIEMEFESSCFESKKQENLIQKMKEKKGVNPNLKRQYQRKGQSVQVFNLNRPKLRARIRTEASSNHKKEEVAAARRHTQYNQNQIFTSKGGELLRKTKKNYTFSSSPPEETKVRERQNSSVLDKASNFAHTEKDSVKHLLTDTISVVKVGASTRQKLVQFEKPIKNICLTLQSRNDEMKQLRTSNQSVFPMASSGEEGSKPKLSKLKTFKQFIVKEGNMFPRRGAKQSSNNYYYFPVL